MDNNNAFQLSFDEQHYAWLAIDVPGEKMNTLQAAFAEEMQAVFATLNEKRGQIKGLIIHSLKPDNLLRARMSACWKLANRYMKHKR